MSSSSRRRFHASVVAGVMLFGTASPVLASDRSDDPPAAKPVEMMIASSALFAPAPPAPIFTVEEQAPQSVLTLPRTDSGLAGPALRRSLIVSFGALQILDAHSTIKALNAGGREANPAMAGIASNRATLVAVKAGTAVATAYFAERLSKNHPKRALVLMAVLNSAYAAIVAHNYRVARTSR